MSAPSLAFDAEERMAAQQLAQEHETLLAFINAAPVGMVQTRLDGEVELINAHTAMLLLPLAAERSLDNLFELLAPVAPDLRALVNDYPLMHGVICDGRRLPLSPPGSPLKVASLRLVRLDAGRLMAAFTDLTAQVQAEQAREQAEDRLRFAMAAAGAGDWTLDLSRQRLRSARLHQLCSASADGRIEGPWDAVLACMHPDDRDAISRSLSDAIDQGAPWRSEFRVTGTDGRNRWLTLHGQRVARAGEAPLLTGVVLETTDQREADAARQRARELAAENERLQQLSQLKSQFLATMSHELRTPLTSVIGCAELLRAGIVRAGTPAHDDCLAQVERNGRHLLALIDDVLDLTAVEAGKLTFAPAPVDLHQALAEVLAGLHAEADRKRLTLTQDIGPGLNRLVLDPARWRQVLYNLLSNALKFTPEGGQISVRARAGGDGRFTLSVRDTGIGIAAEALPRLFTEFHQVDGSNGRREGGTGLGLALTRRLLRAQGGDIQVVSSLGQGSVFEVEMPQVPGDAAPPPGGVGRASGCSIPPSP